MYPDTLGSAVVELTGIKKEAALNLKADSLHTQKKMEKNPHIRLCFAALVLPIGE